MKFLAWVMFLVSTACFVTVFCKQQLESQLDANNVAFSQPTDAWRAALANSIKDDDADGAADVQSASSPTTRPAIAPANAGPIAGPAAVAAGDLDDAVK